MSEAPPIQPAAEPGPRASILASIGRVLVIVAVVAISVSLFSFREELQRFAAYGYPGIVLISFLANASVLLPAPGAAVVFAMGGVYSPPLVAILAATGATFGELFAYAVGYGGQPIVGRTMVYTHILRWMHKYGGPTTFVLAAVPNPFFDLAGIAAGAVRMPFLHFLFWCMLGKTVKMLAFAYTGAYSIEWLSQFGL